MDIYLSIIIPCFNEELVLKQTYKRLLEVIKKNNFTQYEFVFINDGSMDLTLDILKKFSKKNDNVKIINFSKNFGHQCAVSAGVNHCQGDVAVIIDADLQDPPEVIPEMIKIHLENNSNVVYGVRKGREGESFFKKLTAKIFYRTLNYFSDVKIPVDTGDFRLIDKKVINVFKSFEERNKYIRGMISWMGFKQDPVYYKRQARFSGETKYTLKKMLKLASTAMFYFSKKPLKMALNLGFLSIFVGLGLAIYTIIARFSSLIHVETGWASLIITILFFGGVQLFTIGILGEYIGSILDEVKKRPEYIISDKINFDNKNKKKKKDKKLNSKFK